MIGLHVANIQATFDPPALAFSLHLLFMLCTSAWVVHLTIRSFLASGSPGFLLLACGTASLGLAGVTAFAVAPRNPNVSVTIHNTLLWIAGVYHLLGVVLTFKRTAPLKQRDWWVLGGLSGSCAVVAFVALAASNGLFPEFFVQGQGGTIVRYTVLTSATAMFAFSGATLLLSKRFTPKTFSQWYGFGLLLLSLGIVGIMLQTKLGDVLGWAGRTAQWGGGVYLLLAALAAARQSGGRQISLAAVPSDPRLGYAIAVAFVAAATVGRLLFMPDLGTRAVTATFYPAVVLAALFGGRGPGLVAAGLSAVAMDYFWFEPYQQVGFMHRDDLVTTVFFLASSTLVVFVTGAVQRERARAEASESIRATEERLSLAMKAGQMGAYDWDVVKDTVWWSPEVYTIFGVSADSFKPSRESFLTLLHPDDRATRFARIQTTIEQRGTLIDEFRIIHPDGSVRWIGNRAQTEYRGGKPVRHFGMAIDITERKNAEQALRESQTLLSAMMSQLPVGLGVLDLNGKWIVSNALMETHAPKGAPWHVADIAKQWRVWDAEGNPVQPENWPSRQALRGKTVSMETLFTDDKGQERWVRISAAPLRDDTGEIIGATAIAQDIDEIKRSQQKLRDAHAQLADRAVHLEELVRERTAKLQEMIDELEHVSYAITHDMRAPLRAMSGFAALLLSELSPEMAPDVVDYSTRILNAANRLDKLIQDSLQYTKTVLRQSPLEPVDLSNLIHDLLTTYPNLHSDKADICVANQLPVVIGNEALLTQCFSNLLGNAVKFVPAGTRPQIRIRSEKHDEIVRIWIEDNGIGIPAHAHDRLFKMFQRVTSDYEGSGIGLAIVRKVVERMGGKVGVESSDNKGSRFWLDLQIAAPNA